MRFKKRLEERYKKATGEGDLYMRREWGRRLKYRKRMGEGDDGYEEKEEEVCYKKAVGREE